MICSLNNCKVSKIDEPMVTCWLCLDAFHAKCVELSPRTADNLLENKGLRWSCKKCKVFDVEFFVFFKNTRKEFENIENDLLSLMDRFKKYKDILDSTSRIDNFLLSPSDSLRKRRKTSTILHQPEKNVIEQITFPSSQTVRNDADENQNERPLEVRENHVSAPKPSISVHVDKPEIQNASTNQNTVFIPSDNRMLSAATPTLDLTPSGSNKFYSPSSSPFVQNSTTNNGKPVNAPKELKVLAPMKTVFAARFAANTTVEDISHYIKTRLKTDIDLKIYKFKYSVKRSKSSFKIIVPVDNFNDVVNPAFWPPNAIIHEYVYKNNEPTDIVHLPTRNENSSKN